MTPTSSKPAAVAASRSSYGRLLRRLPRAATVVALALAGALAGCATSADRIAKGSSAADVQRVAGAPTEQRSLPDGSKLWYYVTGPSGWTTVRVRFDASDHVVDRAQVLTESNFDRTLVANRTTREDARNELGPPALVTRYPNIAEEVWTYRYRDVTQEMLADVHFDATTGRLKSFDMYPDPAYRNILG